MVNWWLVRVITRFLSFTIIAGVSSFFLCFIVWSLARYFADYNVMSGERIRVNLSVASLALSIVCSVWISFHAAVTLGDYYSLPKQQRHRWRSGDRRHGENRRHGWRGCRDGSCMCLIYVCSGATVAFATLTVLYTWRWWHILETLGETGLAMNCRHLTIYNLVIACFGFSTPLFAFFSNFAGLSGAS